MTLISIGWLYWYFWVVVVAVETVAGAAVIKLWIPNAPVWLVSRPGTARAF